MADKKNTAKNRGKKANSEDEFKFKSIRISNRNIIDYTGHKRYRTVYRSNEVEAFYVDTEWINKRYDESSWNASIVVGLFFMDEDNPVMVAKKEEAVVIPKDMNVFNYSVSFVLADLNGFVFREGVYRVQVVVNGMAALSDEIHLLEAHADVSDYFKVVDAGFDKCCEEDPNTERPHSFRMLNGNNLQDVRFYLVAENRLKEDWTYEFLVNIMDHNGMTKATRMVKGKYYVSDSKGRRLLCFAVDLGGKLEHFWETGSYTVELLCFDQVVLVLDFEIGTEDVPYRFNEEVVSMERTDTVHPGNDEKWMEKEDALEQLYQLVGLRNVKEEITRVNELVEFVKMRQENGFDDEFPPMHMLFMGNPGTGKSTVARLIGKIFYKEGILSNGELHRYRREHLTNPGQTAEEELIRDALCKSEGGILLIEDADELYPTNNPNDPAIRIWNILLNILDNESPRVLVILAGNKNELLAIAEGIPDMKRCFPTRLVFEDYSPDELMEITHRMLTLRQYKFTPKAEEKFAKLLNDYCTFKNEGFENGHFLEDRLASAASKLAKRLMANRSGSYTKDEMMLIREEDIDACEQPSPEDSLKKLNEMIGSDKLKNSMINYINYVYFIRERQRHGFTDVLPPLNMIFTGNPGTGKITVAQMLGEIFNTAGVLESSAVTVRTRGELIGDGSVPPQQMAFYIYEQARGGILYLENAHTLFQEVTGMTALGMILNQLSETENGDTVVILGGDSEEMEKILTANPKLKLLFPYSFYFEDYTPEELLEIAVQKVKEKNYSLHPKAKEAFKKLVSKVYDEHDKHFGNALFVEKMVDQAIRNLSSRTMKIRKERELTRKEITTLMEVDIPDITSQLPNSYKDRFDEKEIAAALKDLDHMVGQAKLKKQIHDFVDLARHYNRQGVKLNTRLSLQWCFTGNSGMGKGTVARIIACLYKAMGIIDKEEVKRFRVEKLIGQTDEEAMQNIGNALIQSKGGLFFFDEDSSRLNDVPGVKERVRALLVNQLAEKPGAYTIIYAKQNPPRIMLNDDVEKVSDMINVLVFEDYTKEELLEILKRDLATEKSKMTRTAQQQIVSFISHLVDNKKKNHASARLIKLVAEMMIRNRIQRVAKTGLKENKGKMYSITKHDVEQFTPEFLASMVRERNTIGYKM